MNNADLAAFIIAAGYAFVLVPLVMRHRHLTSDAYWRLLSPLIPFFGHWAADVLGRL